MLNLDKSSFLKNGEVLCYFGTWLQVVRDHWSWDIMEAKWPASKLQENLGVKFYRDLGLF